MYVGLGLYRGGMKSSADLGWSKSSKVVASQISKVRRSAKANGYSLFSYESLYKKTCRYEVKNMLNRIAAVKISGASKTLEKGSRMKLKASVWPLRLGQGVTWKSSNKKVATISKKGVVKARKSGKVKIYAIKGRKRAAFTIQIP